MAISAVSEPNQSVPPPLPDLPNICEPGVKQGETCRQTIDGPDSANKGGDVCVDDNQCGGSGNKSGNTEKKKSTPKAVPPPVNNNDDDDDEFIPPPPEPEWPPVIPDFKDPPPPEGGTTPPPQPPKPPSQPPKPPPKKGKGKTFSPPAEPRSSRSGGLRGAKFPSFTFRGWIDPNALTGYVQVPNTQKLVGGGEVTVVPNFLNLRLALGKWGSLRARGGLSGFGARADVYGPEDPSPMKKQEPRSTGLFGVGPHVDLGLTIGRGTKGVLQSSLDVFVAAAIDSIPTHVVFQPCIKGGVETRSLWQFLFSVCYYHTSEAPFLDPAFPTGFEFTSPR